MAGATFRAYDIRGVVGETLDAGVAELIGHAIGSSMLEQGLLEILGRREETPDEVFATIPEGLSTPELKAPVADPHAFVARFVAQGEFEGARVSTIDGLRADWSDGWGLVRASNTTPILVLRFEANDANALARIQNAFRERLLTLDPALNLPF